MILSPSSLPLSLPPSPLPLSQSGNHYLDVNVRNKDGLTPLLLVTRDIGLFDKVQNAMENEYNPVNVLQDLLDSHA